jgi:hypothetical protein
MSFNKNATSTVNLEFTPADFFYLSAPNDMPTENGCSVLNYENLHEICRSNEDTDAYRCYQNELCRNKQMVHELNEKQNKHFGSAMKYTDYENKYNNEVLKTMNLAIGIIASLMYIYYSR